MDQEEEASLSTGAIVGIVIAVVVVVGFLLWCMWYFCDDILEEETSYYDDGVIRQEVEMVENYGNDPRPRNSHSSTSSMSSGPNMADPSLNPPATQVAESYPPSTQAYDPTVDPKTTQ